MKYCNSCGQKNADDANFCGNCGKAFSTTSTRNHSPKSSWVNHINDYVGNDKPADLNWRVLFTDVLKKHTKTEAENIFICGTKSTTPTLDRVSQQWPHPWLYSRVFLMFAAAFFLLYICCSYFGNGNAIPGLIMVGSFTVPLTGLILFLEVNAYRNISLYDISIIFLVGGCASLVITLFFYAIIGMSNNGALLVGIIEEVGKAVIVYYFIKRLNKNKILPGLLIGAAVGAGFAAFESAGYAFNYLIQHGWNTMMDVIFLRGFLTPGGHVAWAAITGAAIAIASKDEGKISTDVFMNRKFIRLFIIPVLLHALWDSPLSHIGSEVFLLPIALTLFVWIVVLILINMGLSEIAKHKKG